MRKSTVLSAGCAAMILIVVGVRADAAQPSAARMSQMGLSGAQVVSDRAAMDVRGFGFSGGSRIWGKSSISINGVRFRDSYNSTSGGSQANSTFVVVPIGGFAPFAGGGSFVRVAGP